MIEFFSLPPSPSLSLSLTPFSSPHLSHSCPFSFPLPLSLHPPLSPFPSYSLFLPLPFSPFTPSLSVCPTPSSLSHMLSFSTPSLSHILFLSYTLSLSPPPHFFSLCLSFVLFLLLALTHSCPFSFPSPPTQSLLSPLTVPHTLSVLPLFLSN